MRVSKTATTSLALSAAVAATLGLGACGSPSTTGSSSTATHSATAAAAGSAAPKAEATIPAVSGGSTAVALDAGFVKALTSLKLTPGVLGSATLAAGTVTFPVTGGTVTYYSPASGYRPYVQGVLLHQGSGLSLSAGATTVQLTDFTIDPGKPARLFGNVSVNGKLAKSSAPLFNLDGTTLKPLQMGTGTAVLAGTRVLLAPEAAALLNSTFKTSALTGGLLVGTSTITVDTK